MNFSKGHRYGNGQTSDTKPSNYSRQPTSLSQYSKFPTSRYRSRLKPMLRSMHLEQSLSKKTLMETSTLVLISQNPSHLQNETIKYTIENFWLYYELYENGDIIYKDPPKQRLSIQTTPISLTIVHRSD